MFFRTPPKGFVALRLGGPEKNTCVRSMQREYKPNLKIVQENKDLAGTFKQLLGLEKSQADTVAWSDDMEGHVKKLMDMYCESAVKKI